MKQSYSESELPTLAKTVLNLLLVEDTQASILALSGPLGAGKTALSQAIAAELGITETVVSPTFVIAKWYTPTKGDFEKLVHIDAYRIESEEELLPLGFSDILKEPKTLVIIEWPEKLPKALSSISLSLFLIEHTDDMRTIEGPILHEKNN